MKSYIFYILLCCIASIFLIQRATSEILPFEVNNVTEINEGNTTSPDYSTEDQDAYETTANNPDHITNFCNVTEIEDNEISNESGWTEEDIQRTKDWAKTITECCDVMNFIVQPSKNILLAKEFFKSLECQKYNKKLIRMILNGKKIKYENTLFIKESHNKVLFKRLNGNYTFNDIPIGVNVIINSEFRNTSEVIIKLKNLMNTIIFKADFIYNELIMTQRSDSPMQHVIIQSFIAATVCTTKCATYHMIVALSKSNYRMEYDFINYDEEYERIERINIKLKQVNLMQPFSLAYNEKAFEIFIHFQKKKRN